MAQTADVMKAELEKLRSDLYAAFQTAEYRGTASGATTGAQSADAAAVQELTVEIDRLVQHMETIDKQMAEVCNLTYPGSSHYGNMHLCVLVDSFGCIPLCSGHVPRKTRCVPEPVTLVPWQGGGQWVRKPRVLYYVLLLHLSQLLLLLHRASLRPSHFCQMEPNSTTTKQQLSLI